MPTCSECGGWIEFRHVGGVLTPIHLSGGCSGGGGFGGDPSAGADKRRPGNYLWGTNESYAAPSTCPKCGADVYFVRHNGGSVWFDSLGWPWPKHPCFDREVEPGWFGYLREHNPAFRPSASGGKAKKYRYFVGVVVKVVQVRANGAMSIGLAIEGSNGKRMCISVPSDRAMHDYLDAVVVVNRKLRTFSSSNFRHVQILDMHISPSLFGYPDAWCN